MKRLIIATTIFYDKGIFQYGKQDKFMKLEGCKHIGNIREKRNYYTSESNNTISFHTRQMGSNLTD